MAHKKVALLILDGWGVAPNWGGNAFSHAALPNFDRFKSEAAYAELAAAGADVGLPGYLPGNSEAGHLNLGTGRLVEQDHTLINTTISQTRFMGNATMTQLLAHRQARPKSRLHLIGLVSDGGVHSHIDHLLSLIDYLQQINFKEVFLHVISDGRDTEPRNLVFYLQRLERNFASYTELHLATIIGRFYAMDRDKHADRTGQALNLYLHGTGEPVGNLLAWLNDKYKAGFTDEDLPPGLLLSSDEAKIRDYDQVIVWNFRPDRSRQLLEGLTVGSVGGNHVTDVPNNVFWSTFLLDPQSLPCLPFFARPPMPRPLPVVVAEAGLKQFHIAETEKYAHVTYFFNGGVEAAQMGEDRVLIESGNIGSYKTVPAMKAQAIADAIVKNMQESDYGLIVANFANADMVGHTGDLPATIQAIEILDTVLGELVPTLQAAGFSVILTGDHGNAEEKIDPTTGEAQKSHTRNPVPFLLLDTDVKQVREHGRLADVAPTILQLMGINQPSEMTGRSLLVE